MQILFVQAILEMKKKVGASRDLYSSHLEAVQNVVRLHKANSDACLEEVSALTTSSASSIDEVTPLSISFLFFLVGSNSNCLVDFSFLLQGRRQRPRYLMNFRMLLRPTSEKWLSLRGN